MATTDDIPPLRSKQRSSRPHFPGCCLTACHREADPPGVILAVCPSVERAVLHRVALHASLEDFDGTARKRVEVLGCNLGVRVRKWQVALVVGAVRKVEKVGPEPVHGVPQAQQQPRICSAVQACPGGHAQSQAPGTGQRHYQRTSGSVVTSVTGAHMFGWGWVRTGARHPEVI